MRKTIRAMTVTSAVLLTSASASQAQLLNGPKADDYPIIAQLYGDPAHYSGHLVMIYGLVVTRVSESTFMLQDVSQHPMKIVGKAKFEAAVGDQLIVVGHFHEAADGPYIAVKSLIPAKVLGGGGCC
jgi:hypothetical protein